MAAALYEFLKGTDPGAAASGYQGLWIDENGNIWKADESGNDVMVFGNYQCRAYNSGAQTIADSTTTYLTLDSELYDTDSMHSTSVNTSRITITKAGKYYVGCCVRFASNSTGYRQLSIQINRTQNIFLHRVQPVSAASSPTIMTVGGDYTFAVNDYIEIAVFQTSGGNLDSEISSGGVAPSMWCHRIGD